MLANKIKKLINELDFKKSNGLIPTIVMDENKELLVLAYSNKESLEKTIQTKLAHYYSRTMKRVWQKGEDNKNIQKIAQIKYDCDKDALLFIVNQTGVACHKGNYSCFVDVLFENSKNNLNGGKI